MIVINGFAAMLLVPSWVLVFKPKFIVNVYSDEDGVLHADAKTVDANPADLSSPTAFGGAINGNQN